MAKSSKIKVMISSRCNDMFPLSSKSQMRLSDLRTKMKKEIEGTTVLGSRPFEVWINESICRARALEDNEKRTQWLDWAGGWNELADDAIGRPLKQELPIVETAH